ncbi:MAG: serine/threonine protein phosphatase [Oscillospiraceae bacterium]|nr:serine/threonine protein phosphatase [Oscillospiraceae bacterium]
MGILKRSRARMAQVQLRNTRTHPFAVLDGYVPLSEGNIACYRAIREAVPIVDAAIGKLVRLCGGFSVTCSDAAVQRQLEDFVRTVETGRGQRGLQGFLDSYLDGMLTCGRAVGEIVVSGGREIAAVLCGDPAAVAIREGDTPLDFALCAAGGANMEPLPYQELLLFTPFCPETEHPYGVSLLRSMPFLVELLMTIYQSMGSNFERSGSLRYAVTYKPGNDVLDRANAMSRLEQIAQEWSSAMASGHAGAIRDFVALGDVGIQTIGADSGMPDTETPVRQILEQLVSKTGIPPFMLGLSWSSTERMSAQQADVMTSEITAMRRALTPVLERIFDLWMALHGAAADYAVCWEDINLQDEVEEARARLYDAQAQTLRNE